jgi:hypothetical protein
MKGFTTPYALFVSIISTDTLSPPCQGFMKETVVSPINTFRP